MAVKVSGKFQLDELVLKLFRDLGSEIGRTVAGALQKSEVLEHLEAQGPAVPALGKRASKIKTRKLRTPPLCSARDCARKPFAQGLCSVHLKSAKKNGGSRAGTERATPRIHPIPLNTAIESAQAALCSRDGCDAKVRAKGLCARHFMEGVRAKRKMAGRRTLEQDDPRVNGQPEVPVPLALEIPAIASIDSSSVSDEPSNRCKHPGCGDPVRADGLCGKHQSEWVESLWSKRKALKKRARHDQVNPKDIRPSTSSVQNQEQGDSEVAVPPQESARENFVAWLAEQRRKNRMTDQFEQTGDGDFAFSSESSPLNADLPGLPGILEEPSNSFLNNDPCSHLGCEAGRFSKGMCRKHYDAAWRMERKAKLSIARGKPDSASIIEMSLSASSVHPEQREGTVIAITAVPTTSLATTNIEPEEMVVAPGPSENMVGAEGSLRDSQASILHLVDRAGDTDPGIPPDGST